MDSLNSELIVVPQKFNLSIGNTIRQVIVKPLSVFATVTILKELENFARSNYKKEIIELSKELVGKDKADFLMSAMEKYVKAEGVDLLNTPEGYNKVLAIATQLSEIDLKEVFNNADNHETIMKIINIALDIKESKKEVKVEDTIDTQKKI